MFTYLTPSTFPTLISPPIMFTKLTPSTVLASMFPFTVLAKYVPPTTLTVIFLLSVFTKFAPSTVLTSIFSLSVLAFWIGHLNTFHCIYILNSFYRKIRLHQCLTRKGRKNRTAIPIKTTMSIVRTSFCSRSGKSINSFI